MPQRTFWAQQHETRITVTFELNPLNPGGPPAMQCTVYDQEGTATTSRRYLLPPATAEMAWYEASMTFLNTWMLSDGADAQKATRRLIQAWWDHADQEMPSR